MQIISPFIAFLTAIFLLVSIHEFGHFWVARRLGIKVLRFSIGFGRPILRWHGKDGTEYVIAWIPLGGYVKLLDAREGKVDRAEQHREFNHQPIWSRFLVLIAGPLTNWLLGLMFFWLVFLIGIEQSKPIIGKIMPTSIAAQAGMQANEELTQIDHHATPTWMRATIALIYRLGDRGPMVVKTTPLNSSETKTYHLDITNWDVNGLAPEPLKSLGIIPYQLPIPAIVDQVLPEGAAARAGILPGDKIIAINKIPVNKWQDVTDYTQQHAGEAAVITVLRNGSQKDFATMIDKKLVFPFHHIGFLGIGVKPVEFPPAMKYQPHYTWLTAWVPAWNETVLFTQFNFVVLGKMVIGKISLQGLGGPITIFTSAQNAFKQGLLVYLSFLALFSVMLAIVNILPIPGLDGGHILLLLIELIRGKPLPLATQLLLLRLGIILLILIMLQATVNDVLRLF